MERDLIDYIYFMSRDFGHRHSGHEIWREHESHSFCSISSCPPRVSPKGKDKKERKSRQRFGGLERPVYLDGSPLLFLL